MLVTYIGRDSNSLSILTAIFPRGPELASIRMFPFWILLEQGRWRWWWQLQLQKCKASVKSSPPANQHLAFCSLEAPPVTHPTMHWREGRVALWLWSYSV